MNNSNQHITLEILLKSLEDDFDKVERARIFQRLKDSEPIDEALIGAKMLLEENNWDYKVLQQAFDKTQDKINAVVSGTKQTHQKKNYLKYAAVLIPFVAIAGYFLLNNNKSIDNYFIKESGLPNLMSNNKNDWSKLMQLYKSNELENAYTLSEKINKLKIDNDTAIYYKAVIAYDLNKFEIAIENFKNIEANKQSIFNADAEFRLGFSLLKSGKKEEAKQQFEKIQSNLESPYNSEAITILKEVFN
jgi:TolA-binding protein